MVICHKIIQVVVLWSCNGALYFVPEVLYTNPRVGGIYPRLMCLYYTYFNVNSHIVHLSGDTR